jgi:hypothetical protein
LPAEASRNEIDLAKIRAAAEKALLVRPVVYMREESLPAEVVQSIFQTGIKSLKARAFEYFAEFFSERYDEKAAERIARLAVELVQPLVKGEDEKVRSLLEGVFVED